MVRAGVGKAPVGVDHQCFSSLDPHFSSLDQLLLQHWNDKENKNTWLLNRTFSFYDLIEL